MQNGKMSGLWGKVRDNAFTAGTQAQAMFKVIHTHHSPLSVLMIGWIRTSCCRWINLDAELFSARRVAESRQDLAALSR